MHILVFNAGSSSLKFGVFRLDGAVEEIFKGSYDRFRDGGCDFRFRKGALDERGTAEHADIGAAIAAIPAVLDRFGLGGIDAIGHRVAHGGGKFPTPAVLDDATVAEIETLTPLAPLHNPANPLPCASAARCGPNSRRWPFSTRPSI